MYLNVSVEKLDCVVNTAKEIFVNYSIVGYWIPFLSNIDCENGVLENESNILVKLVRWIVAQNSRNKFTSLSHNYSEAQVTEIAASMVEPLIDLNCTQTRCNR